MVLPPQTLCKLAIKVCWFLSQSMETQIIFLIWADFLPNCFILYSNETEMNLFLTLRSVPSMWTWSICPDPLPHCLFRSILRPLLLWLLVSSTLKVVCLLWHAQVYKTSYGVYQVVICSYFKVSEIPTDDTARHILHVAVSDFFDKRVPPSLNSVCKVTGFHVTVQGEGDMQVCCCDLLWWWHHLHQSGRGRGVGAMLSCLRWWPRQK